MQRMQQRLPPAREGPDTQIRKALSGVVNLQMIRVQGKTEQMRWVKELFRLEPG